MILLGQYQTLQAVKITPQGFYLADEQGNEILLPNKYVPETLAPGDNIEVFLYNDSEDRVVATTQRPFIEFNRVAKLKVVQTTRFGAFLDWGLDKHLLLPHSEQTESVKEGQEIAVVLFLDFKTARLAASTKLDRYINNDNIELTEGQSVGLIVFRETPLGYSVVIEGRYIGLVHRSDAFRKLKPYEQLSGYVLKIRPDNYIDITLNMHGFKGHDTAVASILTMLKQTKNHFLPFNDNSSPDDIAKHFNMSKKLFKKSIGTLYKNRLIDITDSGIELI